jgi:hypothetical protein
MLGRGVLEVGALDPDDRGTVGKPQLPGGEIDEKQRVPQCGLAFSDDIAQVVE